MCTTEDSIKQCENPDRNKDEKTPSFLLFISWSYVNAKSSFKITMAVVQITKCSGQSETKWGSAFRLKVEV